jgi:hypothetical protein
MIKFKASTGDGHYDIYLDGEKVGHVYRVVKYYALIGGRTKVTTWYAGPEGVRQEHCVAANTRRDAVAEFIKILEEA